MRLTWPTRFVIGGGILLAGGYAYWRWDTKKKRIEGRAKRKAIKKQKTKADKSKQAADVACLQAYLQPGARLTPQVRDSLTYASRYTDPSDEIGLNARTQSRVFGAATRLANAGETEDLDRAVRMIVREVMPDCPWDTVAWPPEDGSDWHDAYTAVEELLQLAALEMRYEDYHQIGDNGVGLVCPGWNNLAPAPTTNLRPDDLIEVQLGVEDGEGTPQFTETAWARVTHLDGDTVKATLVGTETELQPGQGAPSITGATRHGYRSGMDIKLHRRCIYSVRKKG